MKKSIHVFIIISILLLLFGCSDSNKQSLNKSEFEQVTIETLPPLKDSPKIIKDEKTILEITEYINNLEFINTDVSADDFNGMSYIITVKYKSGDTKKFVHFGNKFFKEYDNDKWNEMKYEEAEKFSKIYESAG
jgi:hypothetical protein